MLKYSLALVLAIVIAFIPARSIAQPRHIANAAPGGAVLFAPELSPLAAAADLKPDIFASSNSVEPGGIINYTLTLTNNGPDAAVVVKFNVTFSEGLLFRSTSVPPGWMFESAPVGQPGEVDYNRDQVVPGVFTFQLAMTAPPDLQPGAVIIASAVVGSNTPDPSPGNNSTHESTVVRGGLNTHADLSVTKIGAPNPAAPGADISYTVIVTNNGPDPAFDVRLAEVLDPLTGFRSVAAPSGWACNLPSIGTTGAQIICRNPKMDSGSSAAFTIVATVGASVLTGALITNTATVSSSASDPNPDNNRAVEATGVFDTTARADLEAAITASPEPVASGERLTYTIRINNRGPNIATDVSFSSPLPPGTTFSSISQGIGCSLPAVGGTGTIKCAIGALAPSGSASFTYVVNVLAVSGTTLKTSVTVASAVTDPNPNNNSASAAATVQGGALVSLSWMQQQSVAANPTPTALNLSAGPGASAAGGGRSSVINPAADPCSLVRVNVYKADSQPVLLVASNLWKSLPPDQLSTTMAVAPAGSFFVITNVWNCGGAEVESGGSNQVGVPAGPVVDRIRIKPSGKMIISGNGFTDGSEVFIDGVSFSRASVFADSTRLVQKGTLADGKGVFDLITPGKSVVISVRIQGGGISSIAFQQ